jgi:RES domain-containing protein
VNAWRIEKQTRLATATTGEGSKLVGARWNSPGLPLVYASEHLSLAVLEILVHAPSPHARLVARARARVAVPDAAIEEILVQTLPADFGPSTPLSMTQPIGDEWLRSRRSVALLVPSAIVSIERNLLLNPLHPDYAKCIWGRFEAVQLDTRLWSVP